MPTYAGEPGPRLDYHALIARGDSANVSALSLGSPPRAHELHKTLLAAGVVIVEGLDLRRIAPGRYNMACAPLNVVGAEGAPARVFLWDDLGQTGLAAVSIPS